MATRAAPCSKVSTRSPLQAAIRSTLRERLGADVLFASLRWWVLGLRAPGAAAQLQFIEQNLPAVVEQDGWTVEYLDWFSDRSPALPKKVFAARGKAHVRIVVQAWTFADQTP